ncbi:prenylcysteine oxidase 1-like [Styela clava]
MDGRFLSKLVLVLFLHTVVRGTAVDPPSQIAIIGGGIGGSSASHFVREKFGKNVQIDLFEKDSRICGRLDTVTIDGREYESGGSIIHSKNLYMKKFVKDSPNLQEASSFSSTLGIFDGKDYVLQTSTWSIVSLLKMFWTFGLDLFRLQWLEKRFINKFVGIYDLQKQGHSYDTVQGFLHAIGGNDFVHATQITGVAEFSSDGIGEFMIDNLVSPGLRTNYGQNASVNGFVTAVSMAGIQPGLWSVKGGNKLVCGELVKNSSANIINEQVSKVVYNAASKTEKFSVFTKQSPSQAKTYDIVIIAAPIQSDMYHIDLSSACSNEENCPSSKVNGKRYRKTTANFVKGKLNSSLFKCNSWKVCPGSILVSNQDTFYRSIGLHIPVDYDPTSDEVDPVYKVFTTDPMTDEQRDYLFESYTTKATVVWKAYPVYEPPEELTSFVLNSAGLYYTSPMEWVASAMEMSVISAKNAALLAYNNWFGKGSDNTTAMKGEL